MEQQALVESQARVEEVEEEQAFIDLDVITKHGITKTDVNKFKDAGFLTVESVVHAAKKVLLNIKGITEAKIEKVLEACFKEKQFTFQTGAEHLLQRQKVKRITTGVKAIDAILGGGIESNSLTEIYGEFRTGKSQWVHTMVVTAMLGRDEGGGQGKVCVIDTEGSFRSEKLEAIAERFGVAGKDILENVVHARPFNTDMLLRLLQDLKAMLVDQGPYSLIIIDSITSLFRTEFQGRGELSMRQQVLGSLLATLTRMASEFNVAVLYTNQVMSNPDGGMTFVSDPKKPVGGHVLAHASTTRLELRKGRGDLRIVKIIDSPSRPEAEAQFQITDGGIIDPQE